MKSMIFLGMPLLPHVMICVFILLLPGEVFGQTATAFSPDDPYFFYNQEKRPDYPGQWHLENNAKAIEGKTNAGVDAGLRGAWKLGYTGKGVVIGVLDDGVEGSHEDIKENYSKALSRTFLDEQILAPTGPRYLGDNHGTSVAGVAAARGGNGIGGTGAAPYATLADLRVLGDSVSSTDYMKAYLWKSGVEKVDDKLVIKREAEIQVKNHSYHRQDFWTQGDDAVGKVLKQTALNDVIHVWAAGNERGKIDEDSGKNRDLNSSYVLTVGALGSDGKFSDYSSYGANVFVAAPSNRTDGTGLGIITTDRTGADFGYNRYSKDKNPKGDDGDVFPDMNYVSDFGGTSSATPLVSGIMALGKELNKNMDVRMAKHVLVQTSTRVDPDDNSATGGWVKNGAGNWFNPNYGFGNINAGKFVERLKTVKGVTNQTSAVSGTQTVNKPIEYIDGSGNGGTKQSFTFSATELPDKLRQPLEGVEVNLNFTHSSRGDLTANIVSPYTTKSRLFNATTHFTDPKQQDDKSVTDFSWTFLSNAFWGEDPLGGKDKTSGSWDIIMGDKVKKDSDKLGTWNSYNLTLLMGELIFSDSGTTTQAKDIKARSLSLKSTDESFINPEGKKLEVSERIEVTGGELTANGQVKMVRPDPDDDGSDEEGGEFILDGGIVSGTGVIEAPYGFYHSQGTIKPGNSIGTLTLNTPDAKGDYYQEPEAKLLIEVASPTSNDLLAVNGAADLQGILETSWTGGYIPAARTKFGNILTASSGVTGRFSRLLTNITPTVLFKPQYDLPNQIYLLVERDYNNENLLPYLTANQRAVGAMLNSVGNTAAGDLDTVLGKLDALGTYRQAAAAMDQIAPRGDMTSVLVTQNDARLQTANISARLQDIRSGVQGVSLRGLNIMIEENDDLNRYGKPVLLAFNGDALPEGFRLEGNDNWGIFATGNGTTGNIKNASAQGDSSFRNVGITAGVDYRFTRNLTVGLMGGYGRTRSDLDNLGSTAVIGTYTLGVYGTYSRKGFYVDGLANYGWSNTDKDRRIVYPGVDRTAASDQRGSTWTFSGGAGYDFTLGNWVLTPKATLDYLHLTTDDYTESGAGALDLRVNGEKTKMLLGQVGGNVTYVWRLDKMTVLPRLWAMYGREFNADEQVGTTARLVMGSAAFTVYAVPPDRDFANIGGGIAAILPKGASLSLNVSGQVGQSNYSAYNLNLGVRIPF